MANEPEPGRLAIWRLQDSGDAVRLSVDLDYDWTVTLTIGPDGHTNATLSDAFAAWLASTAQELRP